jgi:hypothetical protein
MEPLDKWIDGYKEYFTSKDPATGTYYTYTIEWKTANYSAWMPIEEEKEKTQTLNESRLKEIKP